MSGRLEFSRAEKSLEPYSFNPRLPDGIVLEALSSVIICNKLEPSVALTVDEKTLEDVLVNRRDKIWLTVFE